MSNISHTSTPWQPITKPPVVLTIAGSDPSAGAGIEADLKVFHQHNVYGTAVPTLLTVQNTRGVRKVHHCDPNFFEEQLLALFSDLPPQAIKIGAIGSRPILHTLIRFLGQVRGIPIVVDTPLVATSGQPLFDIRALLDLMERLFPLATLITPNIPEFDLLTGKTNNRDTLTQNLLHFSEDKAYAILLKGGHLENESTDFLCDQGTVTNFPSQRIDSIHTHGTGCALSSAIAANLALGRSLRDAVKLAQNYVHEAIRTAPGLGKGHGPINHWVKA